MDGGLPGQRLHTPDSRAEWRARREAMEQAPRGRRWRGRMRGQLYKTAAVTKRLLGDTWVYRRGEVNALKLARTTLSLDFDDLPAAFCGYRILHLTDLHLDNIDGTAEALAQRIADREVDLCVITGDIRDCIRAPVQPVVDRLAYVLSHIAPTDGVIAILGNHDSASMVEPLETIGVRVLCNEIVTLPRGQDRIHVTGLDDVHRFHTEAAHVTLDAAPDGFGIALVHSPEIADRAAAKHRLYLTGHTHGGQICLPGGRPLVSGLKRHRDLASGLWHHGGMIGYTSRGIGASVIPLRWNCQGEVVEITLRRPAP